MTECQCGGQPDGPHTDICYLQGEIERLRAELESWIEAFGLLSTLHGAMPIKVNDPMGMAKQIESHVRSELTEARKPDCADCTHLLVRAYGNHGCELHPACVNGEKFSDVVDRADRPIRLYEIDAAMAGGEK